MVLGATGGVKVKIKVKVRARVGTGTKAEARDRVSSLEAALNAREAAFKAREQEIPETARIHLH